MIEGLRKLFESGAGTVIFSPLLLLFVVVGLGGFVGISLMAVTAAAFLGGASPLSRSHGFKIFTMNAVQRRDVSVRFRPVSD